MAQERELEYLNQNPAKSFKMILLGNSGVGKTDLALAFVNQEKEKPNSGPINYYCGNINVNRTEIRLQIWDPKSNKDLADQKATDKVLKLSRIYSRASDAAILVFDMTQKKSLDDLTRWLQVFREAEPRATVILAGTKSDEKNKRVVTDGDIKDFKSRNGIHHYIEVTSKNKPTVDNLFTETTTFVLQRKNNKKEIKRTKIIDKLREYIDRIETYGNKNGSINFGCGFWLFEKSRAINRQANYLLAKQLHHNLLHTNESISKIFQNIHDDRKTILVSNSLKNSNYVDRGINSRELNKIIALAETEILPAKHESEGTRLLELTPPKRF